MTLFDPHLDLGWLLHEFAPISLKGLNAKAEMMSRIDNKYVVGRASLQNVLPVLAQQFDVLEIDQRRVFTYDTRYFDNRAHNSFYDHHQGARKRFKVRIRRYVEAELCFLEVKVKSKRGMTVKHRTPHDAAQIDNLCEDAREFVQKTYSDHYQKPFLHDLSRALDVRYKRITLVAKSGGERMTIDTDLQFRAGDDTISVGSDLFILETKSLKGRGVADRCLRRVHERPTNKCSKYCIGMAAVGAVSRFNRFLPAMRKLELSAETCRLQDSSEQVFAGPVLPATDQRPVLVPTFSGTTGHQGQYNLMKNIATLTTRNSKTGDNR
jgi:VTC domain